MKFKRIAENFIRIIATLSLAGSLQCGQKLAGSEVTNERYVATIYLPNGTPAKGANVLIVPADYIPSNHHGVQAYAGAAVIRTTTDEQGRYSLQAVADNKTGNSSAIYNILADLDSLVVLRDSIQVGSSSANQWRDTLKGSASLSGSVKIQPNHDVSTVIVQAIGTNIFVNVNANGRFSIPRLAPGIYRLKVSTSLPDYVPSYVPVSVAGPGQYSPSETIALHYSGIPVITGLNAWFDTGAGTVHLRWNSTDFTDLADYVVYRDLFDSIQLSTKPIAAVQDTFFVDTVAAKSDAGTWRYKYRVAARNNSYQTGLTYKYVSITAVSLGTISAIIAPYDTFVSFTPTVCLTAKISSPLSYIKSITWKQSFFVDPTKDSILQIKTNFASKNDVTDSICVTNNRVSGQTVFWVICTVKDFLDNSASDTAVFMFIDSTRQDTLPPVHSDLQKQSLSPKGNVQPLPAVQGLIVRVYYHFRRLFFT